jgi:hypothetical protein
MAKATATREAESGKEREDFEQAKEEDEGAERKSADEDPDDPKGEDDDGSAELQRIALWICGLGALFVWVRLGPKLGPFFISASIAVAAIVFVATLPRSQWPTAAGFAAAMAGAWAAVSALDSWYLDRLRETAAAEVASPSAELGSHGDPFFLTSNSIRWTLTYADESEMRIRASRAHRFASWDMSRVELVHGGVILASRVFKDAAVSNVSWANR